MVAKEAKRLFPFASYRSPLKMASGLSVNDVLLQLCCDNFRGSEAEEDLIRDGSTLG